MVNLDYNEELSDAEVDGGPLDDEVDEEAMRVGTSRVLEILGDRAQLVAPSQIEQALWDSYYDADKAAEALADVYAEEAVRMNDAVVEVLQHLADKSDKVTPKQIQDALWHYYYDIAKTVSYLDRTYINPPEKPKPKPKAPTECKYTRRSSADYPNRTGSSGQGRERPTTSGNVDNRGTKRPGPGGYELAPRIEVPPEWHFWDTPWLGVSPDRQSVLVGPPVVGGLLGGSGKPSKLQALAAARKSKKAGEKKEPESSATSSSQSTPAEASPVPKKDSIRLDIRIPSKRSPRAELEGERGDKSLLGRDTTEENAEAHSTLKPEVKPASQEHSPPDAAPCIMPRATMPSPFASTLFGSSSDTKPTPESYPLPYTAVPSFSAKPFLQPSPDDVVLAAQSQGSRFTGR